MNRQTRRAMRAKEKKEMQRIYHAETGRVSKDNLIIEVTKDNWESTLSWLKALGIEEELFLFNCHEGETKLVGRI